MADLMYAVVPQSLKQAICHPVVRAVCPLFHAFPDPLPRRPFRLSFPGNIARVAAATLVALSITAPHTPAQDRQPEPAPAPAAPAPFDTLKPPAPADAMRGYRIVEAWIRDWNLPAEPLVEPAFANVAVVLRLDGVVVGRGSARDDRGGALHAAAKEAMELAERRLPWPHDAVGEKSRREEALRLMLSVEFGGAPVPFVAQSWAEFDLLVQAGREGIAVRVGEREAEMFPSQMSGAGYAPSEGAVSLLAKASGGSLTVLRDDPKSQPAGIAKERGAVFYKFPVLQLAQPAPSVGPAFLFRGGRVIAESEITTGALRQFAMDLAANIRARTERVVTDPGVALAAPREAVILDGTLRLGASGDSKAGAFETLLVIQALREFAGVESIDELARRDAAKLGAELFAGLLPAGPPPNMGAAVSAAVVIAATTPAPGESGAPEALLEAAKEGVAKAFGADGQWEKGVQPGAKAMVALALVRLNSPLAEGAVRSIYAETPPKMLVAQMPYLGWAELELAAGKSGVPAGAALRQMRDEVWGHQLTSLDAGEDGPDLVGGIVFTNTAQPLPTWLSLKPVAFLGAMARDERLTGAEERPKEIVRLARACRFARQLAADDMVCHAAADRARAMWGVRTATWEQRQPPEAQALALLAVSQTLRTLAPAAKTP